VVLESIVTSFSKPALWEADETKDCPCKGEINSPCRTRSIVAGNLTICNTSRCLTGILTHGGHLPHPKI